MKDGHVAGAGHRGAARTGAGRLALQGPAPPPLLAGPTWPWRRTQRDSSLHPVAPVGRRQEARAAEERGHVSSRASRGVVPVRHGSPPVQQLWLEVSPGSVTLLRTIQGTSHRLSHLSTSAHRRRKNARSPGYKARLPPVHAGPRRACARAGPHSRGPSPRPEARRARLGKGGSRLIAPPVSCAGAPLGRGPRGWPLQVTLLLTFSQRLARGPRGARSGPSSPSWRDQASSPATWLGGDSGAGWVGEWGVGTPGKAQRGRQEQAGPAPEGPFFSTLLITVTPQGTRAGPHSRGVHVCACVGPHSPDVSASLGPEPTAASSREREETQAQEGGARPL